MKTQNEKFVKALEDEVRQQNTAFMLSNDHIENKISTSLMQSYQRIIESLTKDETPTNV